MAARTGTDVTTMLMIAYVAAVASGGVILGWSARARQFGLRETIDVIDRGEVGDPNNGD